MVTFVTGIGTDVGKSYATGWLARRLMDGGRNVITQKFIQTGNSGYSEDIEVHRRIMGISPTVDDRLHVTAPVIFTYPASPDLAARIDGCELDLKVIDDATEALASRYDDVLIEGAGGLMVPLHGKYLTIDYIRDRRLPVIVVTNGQLGSISHTLLTLHAIESYGITLAAMVYNPWFDRDDTICDDTRRYLKEWIADRFPDAEWIEMPRHI